MTISYLLDTDICIFLLRGTQPTCQSRFMTNADRTALSTVTVGELLFGVERSVRRDENRLTVERFCDRMVLLPFERSAAAHFADIRARLREAGASIGPYDAMIAAQARSAGLVLVTNNVREFARVPGLKVENWVGDPSTA